MKKQAKWIKSPVDEGSAVQSFRKTLAVSKPVKRATLMASAMGVYVPTVNGQRVGESVLMPGWTHYGKRVQYQKYDVTRLISPTTVLELSVGTGWAAGSMGGMRYDLHNYVDHTSVAAQLTLVYTDGTTEEYFTDESWDVYSSPVRYADIYHGETVDLTHPVSLLGAAVETAVKARMIAQVGEDITEQERLAPVEIIRTPRGETVVDFGQNMTGYVELRISANQGDRIVFTHAEVLDREGNFYTDNYRTAKNCMTYVCSGGEDVFKPQYSFQGFRYIRLDEFPLDKVDPDHFRAVAVNSDLKRTGYFRCGNEKINQLYHNVVWGQKSNYLDVPTDCPQRDERLGWTGDAQVFCRTAAINFDVERFFKKWLGDLALDQYPNGAVPGVIPDVLRSKGHIHRISAAWGDAACIVPWEIYLAYGDKSILRQSFPAMKKWVDFIRGEGPEEFLWLGGNHYGDWLAMDSGEDSYFGATSPDLIASAFFARSTELLIRSGEVLGKDMSAYRSLYESLRRAFRSYFMEGGMPKERIPCLKERDESLSMGVTQTGLTLILHFGLCEEEERPALAARLVELIRENGMRMTTGFVGTPYLLHVLTANGYCDVAYELLMQERNPSWLYSVCHGATTMWEHWNGIKEDGSFWSDKMNSFNHYAYGAVFDWIFNRAVGISPVEEAPGYREVLLEPHPNRCLGFAEGSILSRCGVIRSHWYYKGDKVFYELEIPKGVTAHLHLPSGHTETLRSGCYHFAE